MTATLFLESQPAEARPVLRGVVPHLQASDESPKKAAFYPQSPGADTTSLGGGGAKPPSEGSAGEAREQWLNQRVRRTPVVRCTPGVRSNKGPQRSG